MMVNAQIRPYRYQAKAVGIRQRETASHSGEMSLEFRRVFIIVFCAALFLVVACGQLLHWKIMRGYQAAEELQSVSLDLGAENINLLARRARLMSSGHVEAMAAVRLDLHVPGKGQVHSL